MKTDPEIKYQAYWQNLEKLLVTIATFDIEDERANKAMKMLRIINPSYHWCSELDGLAVNTNDCKNFSSCHDEYLKSIKENQAN